MEKRNTILLTVIAIATLLVAVAGATFAYFASNNNIDATLNLTADTGKAAAFTATTEGALTLDVTAANMTMVAGSNDEDVVASSSTSTIGVTLGAGTLNSGYFECSYDIVYTPDIVKDTYVYGDPDVVDKTNINAAKEAGIVEFGVVAELSGANGDPGNNFLATEKNYDNMVTQQTVVSGAKIYAGKDGLEGHALVAEENNTWTFTTNFYNRAFEQRQDAHYAGSFKVENVVCNQITGS